MQIYDISVTIENGMPVWPGDPQVELERIAEIGKDSAANISKICMGLHTGTHVDAPVHFLPDGTGVDQLALKILTGRVYVLEMLKANLIDAAALEKAEIPPRTRRLIIKTRNSQLWSSSNKGFHENFVGITADGAQYLVDHGIKLIGMDYLSVAPFKQGQIPHEIFLKAGVVLVEGLDLSKVSQGRYSLYCLPLKILDADGAPARAILIGV
ncbi:MAG: cyclase family protein [Anaerolineales bacterium]|nr:cyclase family protein [Anaerolineales bacterium]